MAIWADSNTAIMIKVAVAWVIVLVFVTVGACPNPGRRLQFCDRFPSGPLWGQPGEGENVPTAQADTTVFSMDTSFRARPPSATTVPSRLDHDRGSRARERCGDLRRRCKAL